MSETSADDGMDELFEQATKAVQEAKAAVAAANKGQEGTAPEAPLRTRSEHDIFHRVGALTRKLHDALRELGYDKALDSAMGQIPDARARLSYIATLTGQAAEKALSKAEEGSALQDGIDAAARALDARWTAIPAGQMGVEEFKALSEETRRFLKQLPAMTQQSRAVFTDIMLAQDFHDLTGQVIQKVVGIAQDIETQLVTLLIENTQQEKREAGDEGWLNGPVIDTRRTDVVTNQGQVDDLLASLGF